MGEILKLGSPEIGKTVGWPLTAGPPILGAKLTTEDWLGSTGLSITRLGVAVAGGKNTDHGIASGPSH